MLINKKPTNYGYSAHIRYDVKNPKIHVMQPRAVMFIDGEADLTIIAGEASASRSQSSDKKVYDMLCEKDTYRVPQGERVELKSKDTKVILIEDNISINKVSTYLQLPDITEDEPSSDDLEYIDEDD